ncbi:hypothetical protein ANN_06240 [Periplaneta americana]|uniref:Uncharacterized protein n=1 Tax=Periplaneta americana TaxID=6978 RepID=A0ABQ8TD08_PERAM|nr:hypothetical protein ANN_06240 [Periplaneta americana]
MEPESVGWRGLGEVITMRLPDIRLTVREIKGETQLGNLSKSHPSAAPDQQENPYVDQVKIEVQKQRSRYCKFYVSTSRLQKIRVPGRDVYKQTILDGSPILDELVHKQTKSGIKDRAAKKYTNDKRKKGLICVMMNESSEDGDATDGYESRKGDLRSASPSVSYERDCDEEKKEVENITEKESADGQSPATVGDIDRVLKMCEKLKESFGKVQRVL